MSAVLKVLFLKVTILTVCFIFFMGSFPQVSLSGPDTPGHEQKVNDEPAESTTAARGVPQLPDSMIEYLIITPDDFKDAYVPLAEWKTQKGIPAKIVTVEEIDDMYDLLPDVGAEIQQYLQDFNANNNFTLTWVLLGADHEWIPARSMFAEASEVLQYGDDFYPSDFYYAGLGNDWDTNDDGVFGEVNDSKSQLYEVDYNAKAFVGRLPMDNEGQVKNYVNSLLQYERSPLMDGWLSKALMTDALFDPPNIIDDYLTPKVDEGYGQWEDNGLEATNLIEYHLKDDFEFTHLYDYNQIPGGNYSPDKDILDQDTFVDTVNEGYGLVNLVSHSFLSGNGTVSYEGQGLQEVWRRFFYYTDAASMSNGVKKSFMYFSDCDILNFTETDDSNFETLLTNPTGGAIAVVGPTGSTYRGESDATQSRGNWWIADRFWYLFSQGHIRPGENLYRTKYDYYRHMIDTLNIPYDWPSLNVNMISYNLLGDPEVPIWPGQPKYLEVDVPKVYIDSDTIWVSVKDNSSKAPLEDAKVCISGDDGTYIRGSTDINGSVSFPSSFTQVTTFNLTITKDGYIPHIGELRIRPEPTDLAVASLDDIGFEFSTDPPVASMKGNVTALISNLGTTDPEENFMVNFTDSYTYFGVDHVDNLGELEVINIPAGTKVKLSLPWTPKRPGEHAIRIEVDPANNVVEFDETNNVITKSKRVSGPDLRITSGDISISPESGVSEGDPITINVTVTNIDWGQVNNVVLSFYDGNPDADGTLISTETYEGTLNINEKVTMGVTTSPLLNGGIHEYYAIVDPNNTIIESDELNNRAFTSFYVNHLPTFINIGTITVLEDNEVIKYIDLLDENIVSDEDNNTSDLLLEVVNISDPDCGFLLREGRYVDILPAADWFGKAVINISLTDGVAVIYQDITVEILPVNDAPVIDRISLGSPDLQIGEELIAYIEISDVDNELLKVQLTSSMFPGQTFKLDVMFGTTLETGVLTWDGHGNVTFRNRPLDIETFEHTLSVTVFDDLDLAQRSMDFSISETEEPDGDEPGLFGTDSDGAFALILMIILIIVVVVLLFLFFILRRRAYGEAQKTADDELSGGAEEETGEAEEDTGEAEEDTGEAEEDTGEVEEETEEAGEETVEAISEEEEIREEDGKTEEEVDEADEESDDGGDETEEQEQEDDESDEENEDVGDEPGVTEDEPGISMEDETKR